MRRSRRASMFRRPVPPVPVAERDGEDRQVPLYARVLRLRHVTPSGFLCFVFLEGSVALGVLLALAELVSWWGVLALPVTVAAMVKLNDVVAGSLARPEPVAVFRPERRPVGERPVLRPAALERFPPGAPEAPGGGAAGSVYGSSGSVYGARAEDGVSGGVGRGAETGDRLAETGDRGAETGGRSAETRVITAAPDGYYRAGDASALNGPPGPRQWPGEDEARRQQTKRSASWRYDD